MESGCTQSDPTGFQQDLAVLCHQFDHGNTAWRPSVASPLWCRTADDRSDVLLFSLPCAGCACSHLPAHAACCHSLWFLFWFSHTLSYSRNLSDGKVDGRFLVPMHSAFFSIGSLVGSVVGGSLLQLEVPAHWVFPIMAGNGMFVSLLLWKICL